MSNAYSVTSHHAIVLAVSRCLLRCEVSLSSHCSAAICFFPEAGSASKGEVRAVPMHCIGDERTAPDYLFVNLRQENTARSLYHCYFVEERGVLIFLLYATKSSARVACNPGLMALFSNVIF